MLLRFEYNLQEYGLPVHYWNNSSVQRLCRFLYIQFTCRQKLYIPNSNANSNWIDWISSVLAMETVAVVFVRCREYVGWSVGRLVLHVICVHVTFIQCEIQWSLRIIFWFYLKCCIKCLNVSLDCVAFSWRAMVISI